MSTPSLLNIIEREQANQRALLSFEQFSDVITRVGGSFNISYEMYRSQMALADVIELCKIILERLDRVEDELGIC